MQNNNGDVTPTILNKIDATGVLPAHLSKALNTIIFDGKTQETIARELIGVFASEISEDILSSLMTDTWFRVNDLGGVSMKTSNGAKRLINWGFAKTANIFNNSGYYGSFFESNILNMPTNIFAGSDVQIGGTDTQFEIKTSMLSKAYRVIDKILNNLVKLSVFKGKMSVGGARINLNEKSASQIKYEELTKRKDVSKDDIKAAFIDIGVEKIYYKMQSLLLAGVETTNTRRSGESRINKFAYTQLIYFYDLITDSVKDMLAESITMGIGTNSPKSSLIKPTGGSYHINIYMSRLGANDTPEEFAKRENRLYRHKIEFFKNIEQAKLFFEYVRNVKTGNT